MASVEPVPAELAPLLARPYYAGGAPGPIAGTLAHVPELLEVAMPFVDAALGAGAVPARLKEIAILRASAVLECRYCIQTHTVGALDEGLDRAEVEALRAQPPAEGAFADPGERALVAWVEALGGGRGALPVDLQRRMRDHFSEPELVELTVVATATIMLNRYCTALRLPVSAATAARLAAERLA